MKALQLVLPLAAFSALLCGVANAETIFWTDPAGTSGTHVIRRAGPGPGLQTIVGGLSDPRGMALDTQNSKMYWTELGLGSIRRANLDGTGVEPVVATSDMGGGIALDVLAGKLYWSDGTIGAGQIKRANFDGSGIETIVNSGLFHAAAVSLDLIQQKVYWTDLEGNLDGNGKIQRSNLDGSNIETILTGIDEANGLAVDPVAGKIYWPELTTNRIRRANLDGSSVEDVVVVDLINPTTVALDLSAGKIYWTDSLGGPNPVVTNKIERANLDGSARELIVSGVGLPWGIAVEPTPVPEPSAACLACVGLLVTRGRFRRNSYALSA